MQFANSQALTLLLVVPLVAALFWWSYRRNLRLLVLLGDFGRLRTLYRGLAALCLVMIASVVAIAARPHLNLQATAARGPRGDYVLLVDVSRSMAARSTPRSPSSLDQAKDAMRRLIRQVPDARFQVFGYAGLAFPLSTFSDDPAYLADVIDHGVYVGVIPKPGSDLENALGIVVSEKASNPAYASTSQIVLFSDGNMGEAGEEAATATAAELARVGLSLTAVGFGTRAGQRVPMLDPRGRFTGNYESLMDGRPFVTFLQERALRTLVAGGGGVYFTADDTGPLVARVRDAQPPRGREEDLEPVVVGTRDVSWMLLFPLSGALTLLLAKWRDLY